MPTYAYACTECDHRFDAVQSFSDASLTDCPQCTGRLRKLFSAVGIVFKGSGFYRTDNRPQSSNGSASGSANGSRSKPSEGSSNGSGEAKPSSGESKSTSNKSESSSSTTSSSTAT